MRLTRVTGGLAAALLLMVAAGPVALAQDTDAAAAQPATPLAGPDLLEPLGIDIRSSPELSSEELQTRIDRLTAAIEQPELQDDAKAQLSALLEADRAEAARRQAAATAGEDAGAQAEQPAEDATPAAPEQPAAAAEETTTQPSEPTAEAAPADAAVAPVEDQPAATAPAEGTSETVTESAPAVEVEPAPPTAAETTAEQPAAPAVEEPAADAAATAPAETPSVDAPPEVDPAAETKAAALLADGTPADSLTDDALKARVEQYRDLLGEADLSRKTAKALRQRLKADREALRARVAAQEAAQAEAAAQQQAAPAVEPAQQSSQSVTPEAQPTASQDQQSKTKAQQQALTAQPSAADAPESAPLEIAPLLPLVLAPTVAEIPMLLQDERPAESLADDELNRRILATRQALQDKQDYTPDDLTEFDRQLRADRQELNDRLLEDRQQRAAAYKEWDNPNLEINTEPEPGEPEAPNSIFAAEVDDQEMWDQIVMAPLEPIKHRYSRYDVINKPDLIMNQPEIREAMPSIELDTITFGFNEAFVREEEIFDLDRMARMIESVVAAHPDEIFMIEGHTDAVGSDAYNLKLSRQRAQAVKSALSRYYVIPPQNLATVGLGERYLKIWTPEAEEENRRVTVRRVTPLVQGYTGTE